MAEWVAVAALAAGTTISAVSQYRQGKEQRELYKQRAAAALEDAKAVRESYGEQAREKRKEARRYEKRQRVLFAKGGVQAEGTALDIIKETETEFQREAGLIQLHGETESSRLRTQAMFERQAGQSAYRAGLWGAGATVMSGLGTLGMYGSEQGWWTKKSAGTPLRTGADIKRRSQWLNPYGLPYGR